MRTESCIVTIYQDPDTCQNVRVEYEIERGDERQWVLQKVKVIDTITIEPDDLETDILEAIAFEEYVNANQLELDCKIEYTVSAELVRL